MKAIDLIRWALQMTDHATEAMVKNLRAAAMTQPTPGAQNGGNHPVWTLGHLCFIEGGLRHILLSEKNPVAEWEPLFAPGTQPKADAGAYPSFDELLAKFHELRAGTLKMLDAVGEAGLDRPPKNVPPGFEDAMTSAGHTLLLISLHNMVHYGELADVRRVVGLKPLM